MKTLAFVAGLLIASIGAVGIVMPSGLVWISQFALVSSSSWSHQPPARRTGSAYWATSSWLPAS